MDESNQDRVFISYAHEDLPTIRRIVAGLKMRKLNVWFDKDDLGPGRWKPAITKAIAQSRYFVICISEAALRKTGADKSKVGFQDDELNTAYNIAQEQPDGEFTIIPIRLERCGRGDFRLTSYQQYDLYDDFDKSLDRLSVALGGISLADASARDKRTEDEKITDRLIGKAEAAYFAEDIDKAQQLINAVLAMNPDHARTEQLLAAKLQILLTSLHFLNQDSPPLFDNILTLLNTAVKNKDHGLMIKILKKAIKEFEDLV